MWAEHRCTDAEGSAKERNAFSHPKSNIIRMVSTVPKKFSFPTTQRGNASHLQSTAITKEERQRHEESHLISPHKESHLWAQHSQEKAEEGSAKESNASRKTHHISSIKQTD